MNDMESHKISMDADNLEDLNLDDSLTDEQPVHHDVPPDEKAQGSAPENVENPEKEDLNQDQNPEKKNQDLLSSWGKTDNDAYTRPRSQKRTEQERELSMMLKMRGRAFSEALMSIAGTRERSGRLWLTFAATLIVIVLLIIQVSYRHRELNLGYELSAAISQREALLEENRKLRIELRVLSRRERLEPLAGRQLGMSTIKPEQVYIVNTDTIKTKKVEPGKRLDGLDNVRRIGED